MKSIRLILTIILTISLISCSTDVPATHERVGYKSDLKSLSASELESDELKTALKKLGVNAATAEKLAEPRSDAAEEIFVISSKDEGEDTPRLILTVMHTNNGVFLSVDAVWDKLPDDRYLDILGIYCNLHTFALDYSKFTDAWISYDGKLTEMTPKTDYHIHVLYDKAIAMSYDLGALTKEMKKGNGPLLIHFDVYGTPPQGVSNYNLWAYYDHGTNGYGKNVKVVKNASNTNWQFDIKDSSKMSAVFFEMPCPSLLTYKNK